MVINKARVIIPGILRKYRAGILPSNLTRKAIKTEKEIKTASAVTKITNLVNLLFSKKIFRKIGGKFVFLISLSKIL
mgnify:CR=1 FL=1